MNVQELTVYGMVVAAVVAFVWSFTVNASGDASDFRVDKGSGWVRLPAVFKVLWGVSLAFEDSLGAVLAEWMPERKKKISALIPVSALPLTPERVLSASAVAGSVFALIGLAVAGIMLTALPKSAMWTVVPAFLFLFWIGWMWPVQNLAAYAERRQEELMRQLPFAIDLLSSAMRSGLEFGAALRYYTGMGVDGALRDEFTRVLSDVSLGKPFVESLKDMEDRVRIDAFSSFVGAVSYGAEIGAPISATLKVHGAELRRTRFALAERKAARAPIVMILPLTLFIMPSVFIVVLTPMVLKLMKLGI